MGAAGAGATRRRISALNKSLVPTRHRLRTPAQILFFHLSKVNPKVVAFHAIGIQAGSQSDDLR